MAIWAIASCRPATRWAVNDRDTRPRSRVCAGGLSISMLPNSIRSDGRSPSRDSRLP